ncbi:MAG: M48 family metallopeptidase [Clostridia bacterium]|nr:M48 family metallopeptidase [Clostridia bacterium]
MLRTVKAGKETIEYELIQTARASLQLRALPDRLRLFAPKNYPLRQADQFVRDRADWIRQARAQLDAYRDREAERFPMTDGMSVPLEGRQWTLRLETAPRRSARFEDGVILLRAPDISPDAVRGQLRDALIERARARIEQRLAHYIPLIGRRPGRVTIREQRTKWGSCSSKNNLNFNWKLIMAPPEALDYVVVHELCHLYEFNHSAKFWERMARYQPDYAVWRDFLRSGWAHPYN